MSQVTLMIAARNAAATIQRAVRSALAQGDCPILLIDDFSADQTVALARQLAGERLTVVRPDVHRGLGHARQTGILHVQTPLGVWLDADDELLPHRVDRFLKIFEHPGVDFVSDAVELHDGATGHFLRTLPIPEFMLGRQPLARQFERNYLPGTAFIGFRADAARALGYDSNLTAAEDNDFLWRAIAAGCRVELLREPGYRMYAYPSSLSRQVDNQTANVSKALRKHSYEAVRGLFDQAGYPPRVTQWGLISMAQFRLEHELALSWLTELEQDARRCGADDEEILEPEGPNPFPEGWRIAFHKGTVLLLLGDFGAAVPCLQKAADLHEAAEALNNLGVALSGQSQVSEARQLFETALRLVPGYADALANLKDPQVWKITTRPLRRFAARNDYTA